MADYWQECVACGVRFGVSQAYEAARRRDAKTFYCPNGHTLSYAQSEADRLREQLALAEKKVQSAKQNEAYYEDRVRAEKAWREAAQKQASAFKGVATRMKNRVSRGVCPCCNRTFADLTRHMASKHQGFVEGAFHPQDATINARQIAAQGDL